jgi:hypothetical protein
MTVCVYAITSARAGRVRGVGVRGEPLQLVRGGAVAAVVGMMSRPANATSSNVAAYHAVVQRLWEEWPAVLPARFGTHTDDPGEVTAILRTRGASLARRLAAVRGRAQMTVRIVRERGAGESGTEDPDPGRVIAEDASGRSYLRARAAASRRAARVPDFDSLRTSVRRWIRAERTDVRPDVATVYHLVPRASSGAYRRALVAAAAAAGVRVVVTGPFAPFAFADAGWRE